MNIMFECAYSTQKPSVGELINGTLMNEWVPQGAMSVFHSMERESSSVLEGGL